ncbi:tyrosine-protein phosphatase [Nakamurella aerolata]|uniref:Tyrosine-protein phosphatase n=1 Tax=Nakamurella aerolata TaxID=1656892 RepID=A0A849A7B1_9ACTN|nr:tyrosine-protein phosphatase [Nakamurella aerolata]NNG36439.1 tyrosine-protein phosphatase [Nakamurella aerolata]
MANWIELDGVVNMRDVGGIPTTDGGAILPGRLLRSDNLQSLTPADIAELRARDLTDVIDMRSGVEVRSEGPGPLVGADGVRFHHRSVFVEKPDVFAAGADGADGVGSAVGGDSARGADGAESADSAGGAHSAGRRESGDGDVDPVPGSSAGPGGPEPIRTELDHPDGDGRNPAQTAPPEALPWVGKSASVAHEHESTAHYLSYLADRPDSIVGALRDIATAPGAALVHCAAGKDRTGTVVALALLVAGADPAAVVEDYAASSERVQGIVDRLMSTKTYADNLRDRPLESHLSLPETMQGLLDEVDRAGGVEAFLAPYGWTADDSEALRRKLRG